jgi:4-hydroxy-3-methylbut-2-enyl diphosphate reductase
MKIRLAKSAGFCFGVKRAIDIALKTAASNHSIQMLGDIVHNEDVIRMIEEAGIEKVRRLAPGKNKTLLIRAHGAPLSTFKKAQRLGYSLVDATCPMVKEIHKIAKTMEQKGYSIIIIGDKKHDEVHGIIGQLKRNAIVIDDLRSIPLRKISKIRKSAVVVQSTQNLEKILKIIKILKSRIPELKFFNTICGPTRLKQNEIRSLPVVNDVVIIIGSKMSANTKRLFEISKALNQRSYWIQSEKDLKPLWFKNASSVGVTAGASTPDSTTQRVIARLKQF